MLEESELQTKMIERHVGLQDKCGERGNRRVRLRALGHEGLGYYFKKFRYYSGALILAVERHNQMCLRLVV